MQENPINREDTLAQILEVEMSIAMLWVEIKQMRLMCADPERCNEMINGLRGISSKVST
ncbi:MAG: hypothetical protein MHPSP_003197, partial [Paramarteilia canceri]